MLVLFCYLVSSPAYLATIVFVEQCLLTTTPKNVKFKKLAISIMLSSENAPPKIKIANYYSPMNGETLPLPLTTVV